MTPSAVKKEQPSLFPGWLLTLVLFLLLLFLLLGYYAWRDRQNRDLFAQSSQLYGTVLADLIRLHADHALRSQQGMEEILEAVMTNSARLVDELDTIAPLQQDELQRFVAASGLAGVMILSPSGEVVAAPRGWLWPDELPTQEGETFLVLPGRHLYLLIHSSVRGGKIVVGRSSVTLEALQQELGLEKLLARLAALPGVASVRFDEKREDESEEAGLQRFFVAGKILQVQLDLSRLDRRSQQMRQESIAFSLLLTLLGVGFSWLLYRQQQRRLSAARRYEKTLAREREEATLGRAAASIAHEVRNPLNAISMGLQRLQMELPSLAPEHAGMLTGMREAVERTNGIVRDLQRYAQPLLPRREAFDAGAVVAGCVELYRSGCAAAGIELELQIEGDSTFVGDKALFAQAVENLLKNSVEAQPPQGTIRVELQSTAEFLSLRISNDGYLLAPEDASQMLEPYRSSKTQGSGLGLAMVARIVAAHQGEIRFAHPAPQRITVELRLPRQREERGEV